MRSKRVTVCNSYQLEFIHPIVNSHNENKVIHRPSLTTQICTVNFHLLQHISALQMAFIRYCNSKTPWGRILVYKHQVEYSVGLCIVNTYFVIFTSSTYLYWYLHIKAKTHTHTQKQTDIYNQI